MYSVMVKLLSFILLTVSIVHSEEKSNKNILEGKLKISGPEVIEGKYSGEKRSKAAIMSKIMQNLRSMRQHYNMRLKQKGVFEGEIKVQFSIDSNGDVYNSKVYNSTLNDSSLDAFVVNKIAEIKYDKIINKNKFITIIYPFIFEINR